MFPVFALIPWYLLNQCEKYKSARIKDYNFLSAVIELGYDTDGYWEISQLESEAIRSLDVSGRCISDITGINEFANLNRIICYSNLLSSLDVSDNASLIAL